MFALCSKYRLKWGEVGAVQGGWWVFFLGVVSESWKRRSTPMGSGGRQSESAEGEDAIRGWAEREIIGDRVTMQVADVTHAV